MKTNRRIWLQRTAAALAAGFAGSRFSFAALEGIPIVDCHTHFYDPTRPAGVPWPPKNSPLYRPVLPADWRALAAPHGVTKTVVIEASAWLEDNQWILDLAAQEKDIVGFIGNLDFTGADFAKHLARFAANPLFRGVRVNGRLAPADLARGGRALAERDLVLELNGPAGFAAPVVALAKEVPELRIVIDHVGSAGPAAKITQSWKDDTRRAAEAPNVFMKVSGLVEQSGRPRGEAPREVSAYTPILDHLWETFGEDRLVFGSNWPVSDLGADYATMFGIVREFFAGKGARASEKYFHGNSRKAYRWIER